MCVCVENNMIYYHAIEQYSPVVVMFVSDMWNHGRFSFYARFFYSYLY